MAPIGTCIIDHFEVSSILTVKVSWLQRCSSGFHFSVVSKQLLIWVKLNSQTWVIQVKHKWYMAGLSVMCIINHVILWGGKGLACDKLWSVHFRSQTCSKNGPVTTYSQWYSASQLPQVWVHIFRLQHHNQWKHSTIWFSWPKSISNVLTAIHSHFVCGSVA